MESCCFTWTIESSTPLASTLRSIGPSFSINSLTSSHRSRTSHTHPRPHKRNHQQRQRPLLLLLLLRRSNPTQRSSNKSQNKHPTSLPDLHDRPSLALSSAILSTAATFGCIASLIATKRLSSPQVSFSFSSLLVLLFSSQHSISTFDRIRSLCFDDLNTINTQLITTSSSAKQVFTARPD